MLQLSICFVASTLGQGGAERQLYYILKTLRSLGVDCNLIYFNEGGYWVDPIKKLGVQVVYLKEKNKLLRLLKIISFIRKHKFDVVQSVHFHTNLYVALASRMLKQTHIGAIRGDIYCELAKFGYLGQLCFYLPDFLVVNSKASISNAIKLGKPKEKLFFLPNVVDDTIFVPKENKEVANKLTGIFLGSFRQPKRVDRIIKLADKCKNEAIPVEFHLYGEGALKNELVVDAQSRGLLNNNVFFMGNTNNSSETLQSGDFLILTSDNEGTPNVVLEAMSCGLPVISTEVGDVSDIVKNHQNGFVVPVGDEKGLYVAVKELVFNPNLCVEMGRNNRTQIIRSRSCSILGDVLLDMFSNLGVLENQKS